MRGIIMDDMAEINFLSIHKALKEMREGRLDPQDLSEACFRQIERLNPKLNAFITVCEDGKEYLLFNLRLPRRKSTASQ